MALSKAALAWKQVANIVFYWTGVGTCFSRHVFYPTGLLWCRDKDVCLLSNVIESEGPWLLKTRSHDRIAQHNPDDCCQQFNGGTVFFLCQCAEGSVRLLGDEESRLSWGGRHLRRSVTSMSQETAHDTSVDYPEWPGHDLWKETLVCGSLSVTHLVLLFWGEDGWYLQNLATDAKTIKMGK